MIQALIMALVGVLLYFPLRHRLAAAVVWGLTALWLAGVSGMPKVRHGFERAGVWLGRTVGGMLTWVLLAPMYFTVFASGRLILKLRGHDPMRRRFDKTAASYWDDRAEITSGEHWTRQY